MDEMNKAKRKFQKELKSGTAALVLLSVLAQAEEPMYGYQIAKLLEAEGGDGSMVKQGALYPVLRSLESSGLLDSHVEPSVSGPPRRYYHITQAGIASLQEWIEIWTQTKGFVDHALEGAHNDSIH